MAKSDDHGASISSSALNLLNNVVGAGLFSLPWCLKESTVMTGSLLITFMCLMNIASFMLLADSCDLSHKFSYLELGRTAFGNNFGTFAQITTICYAGGSLISYSVLAGDCLAGKGTGLLSLFFGENSTLGDGGLDSRAVATFGISFIFFLPLCLLRKIDSLKYASILAFAATIFAGFLVAYEFFDNPPNSREDDSNGDQALSSSVVWAGFPLGIWQAVPIVNVAFTAHYNGPRFYEELSNRTMHRFHAVISTALGGALLIYLSVGVCGYLTFGDETLGDVLSNFSPTYKLAIGSRAALLVILVAVYPKALHSMRDGIIRLSYKDSSPVINGVIEQGYNGDTLPFRPYLIITLAIVTASAILGAVCTQIEVVLAYKGGIFGSCIVYIIPPLIRTSVAEKTLSRLKFGKLSATNHKLPKNGFKPLSRDKLNRSEVACRPADSPNVSKHSKQNSSLSSSKKKKDYLHLSQHDPQNEGAFPPDDDISIHSNFTTITDQSGRSTQSDFLFDDDTPSTHSKEVPNSPNHSAILIDNPNPNPLLQTAPNIDDQSGGLMPSPTKRQLSDSSISSQVTDEKLFGVLTPTGLWEVTKAMYYKPEHWKCAFIFTWGVCSGLLSVGITMLKQAGLI
mmetsp:Transcript_46947/g.60325  ORF Transcript_46947/g.60325 Transcript_46947/m.60325 type:complete len:625 (-) Transcript_46947:251-2125(-)|eukprot:CAMPEP_0114340500 /NCGR_PEP_ID=MMETSP0101-20121206/8415_1 /TAXON_ID=38822 ORGANISM="Pteridomonas danica, Strain PT" /NCGR_SAMPLE_ID=MMETSP0101 /ASSEMBLY_ACC=CAM_ASM_000211 /LENGTH=624 /DNA_ID=CAMNT_0001473777 /DNA_START=785 /DNA_END=2659 /DNA_ORIENTATION=-